jgi:hypothetical protein
MHIYLMINLRFSKLPRCARNDVSEQCHCEAEGRGNPESCLHSQTTLFIKKVGTSRLL